MAQTDRELLEAAAKAAGIKVEWRKGVDCLCYSNSPYNEAWNPLADDGDALRLAVGLQMDVYVRAEWAEVVAPMGAPQRLRYGDADHLKTVRLAITSAAAAMPARRVFGAA